ncbi:Alanine racemase, biosynthetic [Candidatus Providencia siddallii]|uniref:Alanine racemase n=1 Tax=Candidatus Providencia siddallii TaxID=1715285 RepID=A0A0M6W7J5_9GAMM|nr:Alanine racemase, biosynthetic [Candidatus Providencia siddallii]
MKIATALINRTALLNNLKLIKKIAANSRILAIVKSNAYGHGLIEVSKIIQKSVEAFGVARLNEALLIRNSGIIKPIILLEGFFKKDDLSIIIENKIDIIVHCIEQLEILENFEFSKPLKVWMKLDIGMHRIGVQPKDAEQFYLRLQKCKNILLPINIISHFSISNIPHLHVTKKQINIYKNFISNKIGEKSISASAGILFWPEAHYDWIRPGIIMYGVSPQNNKKGSDFNLQPVMTFKTILIAIRKHFANEYAGYGKFWKSNKNTYLGVIAVGYGDGYLSNIPIKTPVLINGRRVPIVGKISMDMTIIDLGINSYDKVGDEVTLWGENFPIEEVASLSNISSYELLTKLTSRVTIEYVN